MNDDEKERIKELKEEKKRKRQEEKEKRWSEARKVWSDVKEKNARERKLLEEKIKNENKDDKIRRLEKQNLILGIAVLISILSFIFRHW